MTKIPITNSSIGTGTFSLLGIVFVVLKLCNVIAWSWWWVLLPFWAIPAIGILILLVAYILRAIEN